MVTTVGGMLDRLTIVSRKIVSGQSAGHSVDHFAREQHDLLRQVVDGQRQIDLKAVLELASVNAAIWQAEDDLRVLRRVGVSDAISMEQARDACRLAFLIQSLNDQRSRCIRTINEDAGEFAGPEKLSAQGG